MMIGICFSRNVTSVKKVFVVVFFQCIQEDESKRCAKECLCRIHNKIMRKQKQINFKIMSPWAIFTIQILLQVAG